MTRYSEVSYTYSGGSKVFTIPFSYLKTEHINVFIDDVEATDFEFNTTSQIQINDEITSGQVVKIVRTTPIDSRMVNFNDRSVLNAQQQNLDSNQLFNVVQEVYDRNDNFTVSIQTQVDTANTNASAAISTANTASSKADTAVSTANAAETKADNAVSTANSTISIANIASTNATNAVNTANLASSAATAASNKVDEFGQSIETVVEAASKINQLEQSVTTATNAAITATNKASEANTSATTASQKVTEITNLITDFNNQKGRANGIAPLDANTKLQLIHIPTGVELTANKGVANGYAELDADGKVPKAQLPNTGLELCDIGMALYVDETKGLRRYLNGQIVDINTNTQAFLNRLLEIKNTNSELFTTESNWQSEATLNIDGCVYKFVLNYSGDNVVSVRLPKYPDYVEINAGGTLPVVGNGMTLGLTDGVNNLGCLSNWATSIGSYIGPRTQYYGEPLKQAQSGTEHYDVRTIGITTDPTKSGIQTTLKQTKLKMRYFIQIATGSETENNIINEIELNNPYSLFDSKYSDHELNNLSWLKSEGQWNAKTVYTDAYDKLLKVQNGTETVVGLSVKLSTETYTDYDFVLNTANETFRLPLKNHTADDSIKGLTLYFYVGETVQNANLIDAGRIGEQLATKADKTEVEPLKTSYVIETYQNGSSWYRIYSDGWCEQGGNILANATKTLTFLKSFKDTNYKFFVQSTYNGGNTIAMVMNNTKSISSIQITPGYHGSGNSDWVACGYLADGQY